MDVRLPDGTIVKNVPEGITQSDLMDRVAKTKEPTLPQADTAEQIAGNPLTRFALGAASIPLGIAQLTSRNPIGKALGQPEWLDAKLKQIEAMKNKGMEAAGNGGFDAMGLGGAVFSPAGLGALKAIPAATTVLGKIGQGVGIGAGFGATTPVTNGGENFALDKALQTGAGALTGGLLTGGFQAIKGLAGVVGSAIESATEKGRTAILDRFMKELAGDKKPAIIKALQTAKELVPGSSPTAGEAIAAIPESTALAAYQKAVAKVKVISGAFENRADAQEAARKAALESFAKTPKVLETAIQKRTTEAANNYGSAYAKQIRGNPELAQLMQNPYVSDEIPTALKLAAANGISTKTDLTQFLHYIKIGLDKQLSKTGNDALSSTQTKAVQGAKEELVTWIAKANPAYEGAREAFATASKPINQMQVGQYLQDKLISNLGGTEKAASYSQALRDAPGTIKRSIGHQFDKLGQVLDPAQEQAATAVGADLSRKAQYLQRAAGTNLTGSANVATTMQPQLPNLLSRPAMILNAAMKYLGSNAEDKINKLAGERYLDPKALAEALKDVPVAKRGLVMELLNELRMPGLVGAPAITAAQGILSQPQSALLNPQR